MFKFFLKKNFCDVWDNLFYLILTNIIPVVVGAGSYFGVNFVYAKTQNFLATCAVALVCCGVLMAVLFAWGANARKLADFGSSKWSIFASAFKKFFFMGFGFGFLIAGLFVLAAIAIPYYLNMFSKGSYIGILFVALIGWFLLIAVTAFQWFVPLFYLQEQNNFKKCLKKSFIIFFDNPMFSFAMLVHNLILLAATILTFGLIPGLNGITLSNTNALRLRLYKYDYLEEHPEFLEDRDARKEIPWDELLRDDKESLGPRKLSSFLTPWK